MDFDLHVAQHLHHGLTGDAVQESVGQRGDNLTVLDEEDIRAGRFGDVAAIVEHHGVRTAFGLGGVLGHRADHVEAGGLGIVRDGFGRGALPFGDVQFGAFEFGVAVIAAPGPTGDGHADRVAFGGDTHVFAGATPGNRADIGVGQSIGGKRGHFGGLDIVHRKRQVHVQQRTRHPQAFGMFARLEDLAVIAALALEDSRGIVHGVAQDMDIGRAPVHQFTVHPDLAVTIIIACHVFLQLCEYCAN